MPIEIHLWLCLLFVSCSGLMFGSSVSDNITLDMQVGVRFECVGAVGAAGYQHGNRAFAATCVAQHCCDSKRQLSRAMQQSCMNSVKVSQPERDSADSPALIAACGKQVMHQPTLSYTEEYSKPQHSPTYRLV